VSVEHHPHAVVSNVRGDSLYNQSGEVDSERTEEIFNSSINR